MCEGLLSGGDAVAKAGTKIEFLLQGSDLNALIHSIESDSGENSKETNFGFVI